MTQAKPAGLGTAAEGFDAGAQADAEVDETTRVEDIIGKFLEDVDGDDAEAAEEPVEAPEPEAEGEETPEEDADESATEEPAEAAPAKEPAPAKPAGDRARQIAVFAEKERELREREARLKEREQGAQSADDVLRQLARDPKGFMAKHKAQLEAVGVKDPADLAALLYYSELGDDAPPEFRAKLAEQSTAARLEALEKLDPKQIAEQARAEAAMQVRTQMLDEELTDLAANLPAEQFPHLAKFASKNADEVYESLVEVAAGAIQAGNWPKARAIAQVVEDQLAELAGIFAPADPAASQTTQATEGDKREPAKTLTDADTARRTSRPKKKKVEEMTDDEIEQYMEKLLTE